MVTTDEFEVIIEKCGIIMEFAPLPLPILYRKDYIILVKKSIESNEKCTGPYWQKK